MAEYRGEKIDLTIPKGASKEANLGLEWREEYGRGGTEVGAASARRLVKGGEASPDFVRKVAAYFPRHEGDLDAEGADPGEDGYPSAGLIAWKLWGGDPGRRWATAKRDALNRIDEEAKRMNKFHLVGETKFSAEEKAVGDRQVRVVVSTESVDRDGDIVVADGIELEDYRKNPVVLWMHNHMQPIAKAVEVEVRNGQLEALVQFPPAGVCELSDEKYGLIKAGVLNATSIGFMPGRWEALDPDRPYGPRKYLESEMYEFSIVSVGSNRDALVLERSAHDGRLTAEEQAVLARYNLDRIKAAAGDGDSDQGDSGEDDSDEDAAKAKADAEAADRRKRVVAARLKAAGVSL